MNRSADVGSAITQILLCVYLEMVEWVDLFPWNDVRHGNGQPELDVALGILMVCGIVAALRRWRVGIGVVVLLYTLWLGLQVTSFWLPYVSGASPAWQRIYAANFAQTVQWLPWRGMHLPPDANHVVLQSWLLLTIVVMSASMVRAWRQGVRFASSPAES